MKKTYTAPKAEKLSFDFRENVVASWGPPIPTPTPEITPTPPPLPTPTPPPLPTPTPPPPPGWE